MYGTSKKIDSLCYFGIPNVADGKFTHFLISFESKCSALLSYSVQLGAGQTTDRSQKAVESISKYQLVSLSYFL